MDKKTLENKLAAFVKNSGNSDVDLILNIDIDTKAIAYGILCGLYAKGEITEAELAKGIRKLDSLLERDRRKRRTSSNISSNTNKPKIFKFPDRL